MLTRRDVLRSLVGVGAVSAVYPWLTGCGESNPAVHGARSGLAAADVARLTGSSASQPDAVLSVQALTAGLYRGLAAKPGNLVCSPYSVAVALAMTRNGARGDTAAQMDHVLHCENLPAFNAGMNALTQLVDSRAGQQKRIDGSTAEVSVDLASSLWGQHGTSWQPAFLDTLARYYGSGMRLVDYEHDASAATDLINRWTVEHTAGRIEKIIPPGVLGELTRLVLVNAIYLRAPWEEPLAVSGTRPGRFLRRDGSSVQADMMRGSLKTAGYASGSGWQAARLSYAGRGVAMTVIVPDGSGLHDLEQSLDGPRLTTILTSVRPAQLLEVSLPKWKFRLATSLNPILSDLGMPVAFTPKADFSAMTRQLDLFISDVLHDAFIAVDEHGTEAAAATAVVMDESAAPLPVTLDADRAFLFVIHDVETATPLFIGRVDDPTA